MLYNIEPKTARFPCMDYEIWRNVFPRNVFSNVGTQSYFTSHMMPYEIQGRLINTLFGHLRARL